MDTDTTTAAVALRNKLQQMMDNGTLPGYGRHVRVSVSETRRVTILGLTEGSVGLWEMIDQTIYQTGAVCRYYNGWNFTPDAMQIIEKFLKDTEV